MKLGSTRGVLASAALLAAVTIYFSANRSETIPSTEPPATRAAPAAGAAQLEQMAAQLEGQQRTLHEMQLQLAARQLAGQGATSATQSAERPHGTDIEELRAAGEARHREYVDQLAQDFGNEKIDPAWAVRATTHINTSLANDEELRDIARKVECRSHTCRMEIQDDGTVQRRMPYVLRGLADVVSRSYADYVDQGNGQRTMILYLSNGSDNAGVSSR